MKILLGKFDFIRNSNVYIKEGYLEKYRWYSDDEENIDHILHMKCEKGIKLTEEETNFIVDNFEGVIIESGNNLRFISYTGNMHLTL